MVADISIVCMHLAHYLATTMFVRARKSAKRLRLSLVETRRVNGKVHAEHVASLGLLPSAMTVNDRVLFWERLPARLGNLANRIGSAEITPGIKCARPKAVPKRDRSRQPQRISGCVATRSRCL